MWQVSAVWQIKTHGDGEIELSAFLPIYTETVIQWEFKGVEMFDEGKTAVCSRHGRVNVSDIEGQK
jgi:hypothetical protein